MVAHAPLLYLLRRPLSFCELCPVMGRIVKWHVSHIAVLNSSLRPESWHTMWVATLAQLVEHPPCKRTVVGSSPTGGSIIQSKRVNPVWWLALAGWPAFPCYSGKWGPGLFIPVVCCGCAGGLRVETYYRAQCT